MYCLQGVLVKDTREPHTNNKQTNRAYTSNKHISKRAHKTHRTKRALNTRVGRRIQPRVISKKSYGSWSFLLAGAYISSDGASAGKLETVEVATGVPLLGLES